MTHDTINPHLALTMARQFGITIMHGESEQIVQMLKAMHRQGFENGAAIEREACAMLCEGRAKDFDELFKKYGHEDDAGANLGASQCAQKIRARHHA